MAPSRAATFCGCHGSSCTSETTETHLHDCVVKEAKKKIIVFLCLAPETIREGMLVQRHWNSQVEQDGQARLLGAKPFKTGRT